VRLASSQKQKTDMTKRIGRKGAGEKCDAKMSDLARLCHEIGKVQQEHWLIRDSLGLKEKELKESQQMVARIAAEKEILENKVKYFVKQ